MKALILIAEGFEDSEFYYPFYRLQEDGIGVDVVSLARGPVLGKHGYEFEANLSISDVNAKQYDILILPGGKGPEALRQNDKAVSIVREAIQANKTVASICHGAQLLISAGALKGRKITCYAGIRDDVKAAGADYRDEEVVVDGNLITSRHPGDLPAFMRQTLKAIKTAV